MEGVKINVFLGYNLVYFLQHHSDLWKSGQSNAFGHTIACNTKYKPETIKPIPLTNGGELIFHQERYNIIIQTIIIVALKSIAKIFIFFILNNK